MSPLDSETPPVPKLSPRQSEVLESVARGLSNEDISKQLGISVARVREHLIGAVCKNGHRQPRRNRRDRPAKAPAEDLR